MRATKSRLPRGFEALEPFLELWAKDSAAARAECRRTSSAAERTSFYDAARMLLPSGLAYLDQKPLAEFDESDKRLMSLLLSLAHVSLAVETQADQETAHAESARHLKITRAPSDPTLV